MNTPDPYHLLTRDEVAEHLHCSVAHVSLLTTTRQLQSIRVGKHRLVPRAALEAFIRGEPMPNDDGNWPPTPSMFNSHGQPNI